MGKYMPRALRSVNDKVCFSLREYVERLAGCFGTIPNISSGELSPGPIGVERSGYHSPRGDFAVSYLFGEILSKYDDGKANAEKDEACLQRFIEAEELCRDTNARFLDKSFLFQGNLTPGFSVASSFWRAQRKIEWLLGTYQDSDVLQNVGFGPGATTRFTRRQCDVGYKLGGIPHATPTAASFVRDILPEFPLWESQLRNEGAPYEIVQGNKVVSVPKNYKTNRMIAIEPEWNMFLQKGIGGVIRKQLRRIGIELNDQSNNAFLAGLGSITGELATIDLSMASDCVSYELVRFLLPPEWFDALEQCRSPLGVLASGDVCVYQKFSSMGNGYTFELETLIFWALASSVIELMELEDHRCLVYGDDLVIPSEAFQSVCDVLQSAGFKPNAKKSFGTGPFRESCGSHFYEGDDVTPIYVREAITSLDRLFLLHNNTCRLLQRLEPFVLATPEEVTSFLEWIKSHASEQWRKPRLPRLDVGDGAFYGSFEECNPRKLGRGWEGWKVKTLQSIAVHEEPGKGFQPMLKGLWLLEGSDRGEPLRRPHVNADFFDDCSVAKALNQAEPARFQRLIDRVSTRERFAVTTQTVLSLVCDYTWWNCFAH
jgi:hypothetical protein